jgi:hypothetical protein
MAKIIKKNVRKLNPEEAQSNQYAETSRRKNKQSYSVWQKQAKNLSMILKIANNYII